MPDSPTPRDQTPRSTGAHHLCQLPVRADSAAPPNVDGVLMLCEKYLEAVLALDVAAYRSGQSVPGLVMERLGDLTVEYAPFCHIERDAKLVIVGLTPGRTQAANALDTLAKSLRHRHPLTQALVEAKVYASFSGPMRSNLVAMLDAIGVAQLYGRSSTMEFFHGAGSVHFTSALRYPVYIGAKNYSGTPNLLRHPILRRMIDSFLAEEAEVLLGATWIALGSHAEAALLHLCENHRLRRDNILIGLPHPSGANAERIAYFLDRKPKSELSPKTNAARLDECKARLISQVRTKQKLKP